MGYIQTITRFSIIIIISFSILGPLPVSATISGNFIRSNPNYYPETQSTIYLANLSIGYPYGLEIGANQNTTDQQWINFTAADSSMSIPFIHFDHQSYYDNRSQPITTLFIILYDRTNSSALIQIDFMLLYLITVKQQINPAFLGMLVVLGLGSLFVINIIFAFVKQFL